jgi:[CysO sulfur-carrier protein]-S-L-cysteine hydrolase
MVQHGRFVFPDEACGLLASDATGRLRMAYCLTNTQASPSRFTLDPTEHFRAMRHAERIGWHLSGVFHSHTHSAAYPSPTDVAAALEPEWLYVVVSLRDQVDPEVRGYWIRDGKVEEEPLVVPDPTA